MAEYAYVENGTPIEFYDFIPKNWRNISGLNLITDETKLNALGWYFVIKIDVAYDSNIQRINGYSYAIDNGKVTETPIIEAIPEPEQVTWIIRNREFMFKLRQTRNQLLSNCDWTTTTDVIANKNITWHDMWVLYRQQLRDLPVGVSIDTGVIWPTKPTTKGFEI